MKTTNKNHMESANRVKDTMKTFKNERNLWKAQFESLAKLLRDAQSTNGLKITKPIFAHFGITKHVNQNDVLAHIPSVNFVTNKKGVVFPCYVSQSLNKDEKGNVIKDAKGNNTYNYNLVRVSTWSLDKLIKVLESAGCNESTQW